MPFETTDVATSGTTVTDNAIGSRGIDAMIVTTSSGTATSFPLYDAHGNMVATLARSGSTFTTGNQRSFDAWGGIRGGPQSGAPKGRYCAQLGHVQDDESGLVYMRARYYEPGTGRFVSQDRKLSGVNGFAYGNSNPIDNVDCTGQDALETIQSILSSLSYLLSGESNLLPGEMIASIQNVLMKDLTRIVRNQKMACLEVEDEADADGESAPYMRSFSDLQAQIADAHASIGVGDLGVGAAGIIAMGCCKDAVELLEDTYGLGD